MQQPDDLQQRSKTIAEFCEAEGLSPSSYYKLRRMGLGPDEIRVPGLEIIRITVTAHREWRERMTKLSQSKQGELERERRAVQRRAAGFITARKYKSRKSQEGSSK